MFADDYLDMIDNEHTQEDRDCGVFCWISTILACMLIVGLVVAYATT